MTDPRPSDDDLRWYLIDISASPEIPRELDERVKAHPVRFESETAEGVAEAAAELLGWRRPEVIDRDPEGSGGPLCFFRAQTPNGLGVIVAKQLPMGAGRPMDPAEVSRRRARKYLALAKQYAEAGYAADAVLRLEAIVSAHADAPAAAEARELLEAIRRRLTGAEPYGYGRRSW